MSFALVTRRSALSMGRRIVRYESTATKAGETAKQAASKASATASEYTARAQQGLSRVTSAAGPAIANAAKGVTSALGRVGGRTGRVLAFVERQVPFAIYYSKVGLELAKVIFKGQNMAPPPLSTFQTYYQTLLKKLRNPSTLLQSAQKAAPSSGSGLSAVRSISRTQLVAGGVLVAECLGFFTVGEMIGRFKLIGYHGEVSSTHH